MKPILFYHAPCPDGFGAAWSFWKAYGDNIEYHALKHGANLPDVEGRDVFFADIAPSREIALEIEKKAKSITILDHHISKYDELKDLPYYIYSDKNSGAVMSWNFLFPNTKIPEILLYIEDRDTWRWQIKDAKEILSVLDSLPYNFKSWDEFNKKLESNKKEVWEQGTAILQYCQILMNKIMIDRHTLVIRGIEVPAVNTPFFRSEILSKLCLDHPFSAGYHYDGEYFIFSLRSTDAGMDVAKIASSFPGGGGHRNASGFRVKSLDELN